MWVAGYELRVTGCEVRVTYYCSLKTVHCSLITDHCFPGVALAKTGLLVTGYLMLDVLTSFDHFSTSLVSYPLYNLSIRA